MNVGYTINSSAELATFCHELSKHVNVSSSRIKSALGKMKGYGHVSAYVDALDNQAQPALSMTASEWMSEYDNYIGKRDTWTNRANVALFFILNCLKATRNENKDSFTLKELTDACTPSDMVLLGLKAYSVSDNSTLKSYIVKFINNVPDGDFDSLYQRFESGDKKIVKVGTFLDQLGYMTMQIEPFFQEKGGWQLLV